MRVAGVAIPPDEPIIVVLAAANRDPKVYSGAHRFDPWRWLRQPEPPAVLSFAFGPHFCLGAHLARLENEMMLRTLLAVRPDVALAGGPLERWHTGLFRGLAALPVRLGVHAPDAAIVGGDAHW